MANSSFQRVGSRVNIIQPHTVKVAKPFIHSMLTLLGGNVVAQFIPYVATIFLARFFKPALFGYLALFTSIASTLAIVATGRYELAVLLPKKEQDAKALVFFALLAAFSFSMVLCAVIGFLPYITAFNHHFNYFEMLLPVAVFAIAAYQILSQWILRLGRYHQLSMSRFIQASITVVISCTLGWLGYERGLIIGYVWGWIAGAVFLLIFAMLSGCTRTLPSRHEMKANAWKYSDHVIFGAIPALLDTFATFILIFIINQHYGSDYAGQYSLSRQFIYGPISLVASAIAQVIFRESSQRLRQHESDRLLFKMVTKYLTYAAILYVATLLLCGSKIFGVFFGSTWKVSGQITLILAAAYGARLIVSTLSGFLLAHNSLRLNGVWQGLYFFSLLTLYFFNPENPLNFFIGLTALDLFLFTIYFGVIRWVVVRDESIHLSEFR